MLRCVLPVGGLTLTVATHRSGQRQFGSSKVPVALWDVLDPPSLWVDVIEPVEASREELEW
jgi:hypothetical protein